MISMTTFCIQIQPDRAPGINLDRVRDLCKQLATDAKTVSRHGVVEGDDDGPYVNLMFEVIKTVEFWQAFEEKLYQDAVVGEGMKLASMATCTGELGWDDYLLLYHYDKGLELDDPGDH